VPNWVRNIELFMDNAGKTNKNKLVFAFLSDLVAVRRFDLVLASFMIAGHTKVYLRHASLLWRPAST
jgi:hypothetical protein